MRGGDFWYTIFVRYQIKNKIYDDRITRYFGRHYQRGNRDVLVFDENPDGEGPSGVDRFHEVVQRGAGKKNAGNETEDVEILFHADVPFFSDLGFHRVYHAGAKSLRHRCCGHLRRSGRHLALLRHTDDRASAPVGELRSEIAMEEIFLRFIFKFGHIFCDRLRIQFDRITR